MTRVTLLTLLRRGNSLKDPRLSRGVSNMVDKQLILDSVGPVQAVLDAHDGVVNVVDTTDGVIMISLEGIFLVINGMIYLLQVAIQKKQL